MILRKNVERVAVGYHRHVVASLPPVLPTLCLPQRPVCGGPSRLGRSSPQLLLHGYGPGILVGPVEKMDMCVMRIIARMYSVVALKWGQISPKSSQRTPHGSTVRVRYRVSSVSVNSDDSVLVSVTLYATIPCYVEPRYNGTQLYYIMRLMCSYLTKQLNQC